MTRIPSSQGLVWRSAWEAPGEGGFSVAAKIANANELQFADVSDWVFSKNETAAILGSDTFRPILCCDRVRYCRKCMAKSYHAWLSQLWQLDTCPIHDLPLRTSCEACLAPTTLFPYNRRIKTAVDLRCPRCTEPYGLGRSGLSPAGWGQIDGVEKILTATADLQWLFHAIPFTARLINRDQWAPIGAIAYEDKEEIIRGKALFWILEKIYGPGQGHRNFEIGLIHERTEGLPSVPPPPPPPAEIGGLEHRLNAGLSIDDFGDAIVKPSFGAPVPVSSKVPPWVHALSLWQLQHKDYPDNPSLMGSSGSRYQADWLAASKIAMEWHQTLVQLEASSNHSVKAAALLTTDEHWCRRLCRWASRDFSPVLHIADGTQKICAVI